MFSNHSTTPPLTEALTSPVQKTAKVQTATNVISWTKLEEEEEEEEEGTKEKPKTNCRQTDRQTDSSSLVVLGLRHDDCERRICRNGFGNRSWKTMEKQIQACLCVCVCVCVRGVVGAFRVSYGFAWDSGRKQQECAYVQALSKLSSPSVTLLLHSLTYYLLNLFSFFFFLIFFLFKKKGVVDCCLNK